ncbi:hypothetical protein [Clostridium sp. FP1]|uniref:hypothetical protein n=1 Tax=Clostridium sp. FP1 TaxID=2724076 RepID=UPI0013E923DA|nr:hypothetical protein [Clostridium sp. FP1]MBZ9633173.1 hypothetical protein [Clostridium sp. FP1]
MKNITISFAKDYSDESKIIMITETAKVLKIFIDKVKPDTDKNIRVKWLKRNIAEVSTKYSDKTICYK